jgi:predicted secreted protein
MLTAIKSMTPFTLMWDETSTTDNQSIEEASYARKGQAYLNDLTLQFDDRTNSAKSLQFQGTSALEKLTTTPSTDTIAAGSYTKGQFVRLFLSDSSNPALVVAGAKTLSLHVSLSLEDATTKDTPGTWSVQEPTGYTYDISSNALVASNETITSGVGGQTLATLMDFYEASTLMYWQIANVSGANQRTKGSVIASGQARITSLAINAANRQVATYDTQLSGYGEITVGA